MFDYSTETETLYRYNGGSMWPLFQVGDLLVVKRVLPEQLRSGDCIVYRKTGEEQATIHRIIRVEPDIRTRGDARPVMDDEPIAPDWIVGRVEGRIRYGRSTRIWGGIAGMWASRFYRYAGKLAHSPNTRGRRIARLIQRLLGPVTTIWLRRARVARFNAAKSCKLDYLMIGGTTVGVYDEQAQAWSIAWPYFLVIDPTCY